MVITNGLGLKPGTEDVGWFPFVMLCCHMPACICMIVLGKDEAMWHRLL